MGPIPSKAILSPTSTARGVAEPGDKGGSPTSDLSGESRFGSILKSTAAGRENPANGRSSAQGGRRFAIPGEKPREDASGFPSDSSAAWGSVAPIVPGDSRAGAAVASETEPKAAVSAKSAPAPVSAGAATLAAEGDPLLKPLSSVLRPVASDGGRNAAPQSPATGGPVPVPAPAVASETEPKAAVSAKSAPAPVSADAATLAAEGDPRVAEGTRKRKVEESARNEGRSEPVATPPADGNRGVAERHAPLRAVAPAADPGVVRFEEKSFVITRKSDTSVEVTLAPPGVGKLEIEVVLDKGIVNARIVAANPAGREEIARSLPHIVEALARDGMNIGGFTVSLKERRDRPGDPSAAGAPRDPGARLPPAVPPAASAHAASAGFVDIFV